MAAIRQQLNIAAPTRTVWNALTTEDGLTSWWVDEARLDAREGGRVGLISEGDDGEPVEERGMVHTFRPTRKFEIAWDTTGASPTKGTRVEFGVARDGKETRVSVVHRGGGVLDDEDARAELDKAWKAALRALRSSLETD